MACPGSGAAFRLAEACRAPLGKEQTASPRIFFIKYGDCAAACRARSHEDLNAVADGLAADGAGAESGAAGRARAVAALEHQADVAVNTDGASDALLHLPVAALQLLHQLPRRAGHLDGVRHLRTVCGTR